MFISIICPTYNEERYIAKCIESLLSQDVNTQELEIFIIDGLSTDRTREIVEDYQTRFPNIFLLNNERRIVSPALNIGIKRAKGDFIIRIDAHCVYPSNYISRLVSLAELYKCDNIGGLCRTLPADSSIKARSIATAMSHSFGVGGSTFRVGTDKIQEVDTVPFGCFRRTVFEKIGYFDDDLIRNQDDEFNGRIIKSGGKILLVPDLAVDYYARDSFAKLFNMFYQYGLFKPLVNKKLGAPATIRQFFPLLFVLGLVIGAVFCWIHPILIFLYFGVLLLYLILDLIFSVTNARTIMGCLYLMWSFFVMHIGYGLGYLVGIYKIVFSKRFVAESNH